MPEILYNMPEILKEFFSKLVREDKEEIHDYLDENPNAIDEMINALYEYDKK